MRLALRTEEEPDRRKKHTVTSGLTTSLIVRDVTAQLCVKMARSLADVEAQIKTLLGDPVKKAAAFEERDWAGVIAILKPEGGP